MPTPSRFGRYRVIELLGKGAMGEVYKAVDTEVFDRVVAVKVLSERLSENDQARKRFENEVRTAATLDHPNIVRIYDRGVADDGRPFFVMELLDGPDLGQLTSGKETRDLVALVDIGRQIADALEHAHERGVIHRDVKPSNIKVIHRGDEERAKLLDFGIVHIEGSDLTRTTDQPGTWSYMDPERMRGFEADNRSDLFALGIVLYEMFTHVHPFQAPTQPMLLARIMNDQPERPRKINPEIPSQLEALILKLLEKDPEQRPPRAKELVIALRDVSASLRSTEAGGTPSDISADEVTAQAIRTMLQRARRFESDGDREQALKLWRKAAALAPDEIKLSRKVERLEHEIQRDRSIEQHLREARRLLDAGDVASARGEFEKAWLLSPEQPKVLDFKIRLDMAQKKQAQASTAQPAAPPTPEPARSAPPAAPPPPPAELSDALREILTVLQKETEGWRVEARNLLIRHLRTQPDDAFARQWLEEILDGRKPSIEGFGLPPAPPWSDDDRERMRSLQERIEQATEVARIVSPDEVAALGEKAASLGLLEEGLSDPERLGALARDVENAHARVIELMRAEIRSRSTELEQICLAAADAVEAAPIEAGRKAAAELRAIDPTSPAARGLAALRAADDARRRIHEATNQVLARLRERIARLPADDASALRQRLDGWERGARTDPLGALLGEVEAAERGSIDGLVLQIRSWARLLDGSGAVEPTALERFLAIAAELERADPATAQQRAVVASGAVDALRTAHARATSQLGKSRESLREGVENLLPAASEAERAQARDLLEGPLPEVLVEAQEVIAGLRQWTVTLRAREEQTTRQVETLATEADRCLQDPWLERDVAPLEATSSVAQDLLGKAKQAGSARGRLESALSAARTGTAPAAGRIAGLEESLEAARAAIDASRSAHEKSLQEAGSRRNALVRRLEPWKQATLPDKVRARIDHIEIPQAPAKSDPSAIRAHVQQLDEVSAALDGIEERVQSLRSELTAEADALCADIDRVLSRPRFPRLDAAVRQQLEASRTRLGSAREESESDLAQRFDAVRAGSDALDAVPRNMLPLIAATALTVVVAAGAWLAFAPRELRVVPGLAASDPWLHLDGSDRRIDGAVTADGTLSFRVGRGRYVISYSQDDETRSYPHPVTLGLASLPVPFTAATVPVGERAEDRIYELLEREYPELVSGPER